MKHYLNVCDVNGAEVEPVDVIAFGSPCQDLSVAGKRAGLKHESNGDDETTRSGLFMEAVRIIKEMRKKDEFRQLRSGRTNQHIRPRFAVWENVPGAFSSNKGEDFRIVLEELARIKDAEVSIPMPEKRKWKQSGEIVGDGWSIAWRTLDAQYHGVPQRRRRIFLVADFADECAGEILFECQGLPGYPSQSREKGQGTSRDSSDSIGKSSERECIAFEPGLAKRDGSENRFVENCTPTIRANMGDNQTAVAYTLQIRSGCEGGGKGPLIQTDKSACLTAAQTQTLFQPIGFNRERCGAICMENKMPTILAASGESGNNMPMVCCIQGSMIGRKDENGPQGDGINSDKAFTLNTIDRHAVAYGICSYESNSMKSNNPHSGIYEADTARTLDLNGGNPACNQGGICICEPVAFRKTAHPRTSDEGQGWEEATVNDTLNIFDSGETRTPTLVCEPIIDGVIDVETEVYERKYKVDCKLLCECLREHKFGLSISNKEISEQLNVPLTMVEHWFRQDKSFSIPDADIWFKLKELLGIQTDEFDEAITTFIVQPGKYDMGNRIYVGDISPTLTTQSSDYKYLLPLSIENHPNDSRMGIREDGTVQTLTERMGTGGGNVPLVAEPKCYSIDDTKMANTYVWEEQANTLAARDYKGPQAVCYQEQVGSLCARNYKGIGSQYVDEDKCIVEYKTKYIVRRLTPTECARLQGMPDLWCRLSQIEDMSDEDYEFWKQAHKTYAEINGKKYKEKTKKQMITWYNKLQVDSAEYKAYGNGMALPCVRVPIHGIAKHGAKTMASLFDGIGGFPLAGLIDGIKTLWTSEIELFPIAVTMERFREYEKYGCFTFGCDGRFE